MNYFDDNEELKFSLNVLDTFVLATNVTYLLGETQLSTLDFVIASLDMPFTILSDYIIENSITTITSLQSAVSLIIKSEKLHQKIFTATNPDARGSVTRGIVLQYTDELYDAIIEAGAIASSNNMDEIDIDLIVACILRNKESVARIILDELCNTKKLDKYLEDNIDFQEFNTEGGLPSSINTFLDNLSAQIPENAKCDIVGRDKEILQLWNIMAKKDKRNAILIGEPGVGKTAIIEAITYSIKNKTCPDFFKDYTVYSLNLNSMVAGTKYRGEFEQKVQDFINFVMKRKNIIIFIDEIHMLLGTGAAEGSGPDLSGSLKPLLARDDIVLIGATTTEEYERIFSIDGALSRRFEIIVVEEPKFDEVKPMIKARVQTLSKYHKVSISDKMLDKVLIYATAFSNIANPDRTIDLLDKSMAMAKMTNKKTVDEESIKGVYAHLFRKYEKFTKKNIYSTAWHEAGHFVAWLLSSTKLNEKCILVSIVPAQTWLGVTMFEGLEVQQHSGNMTFLKEMVAVDLAGRISQSFIDNDIDAGASGDLEMSTYVVENYIMKYGIFEEFKNYSFVNYRLSISDKTSDKIREVASELVNEVYEETEKLLSKHKDGIKRVAEALATNGIITGKQAADAFYNKQPRKKKPQEIPEVLKK